MLITSRRYSVGLMILLMLLELRNILGFEDTMNDYDESNQEKTSPVEIRAVYINCETAEGQSSSDSEITRFQRQELFKHNALRDCNKKLALTVKMASEPNKSPGDEYIPIDHVLEGANRKKVRLVNPYILRLLREAPLQAYTLHRMDTVSGVLTQSDRGKFDDNDIMKRSRMQRDLDHLPEAEAWSQVFTLEHDEPGRQSYSVRVGNLQDLMQETETTTDADTQIPKDCGLSIFNETPTKAKQVSLHTITSTQPRVMRNMLDGRKEDKRHQKDHFRINREVCLDDNKTSWIREKRHKQNLAEGAKHRVKQRIAKNHYDKRIDHNRDIPESLEMPNNDIYNRMGSNIQLGRSYSKPFLQSEPYRPDLSGSNPNEAEYESANAHMEKDINLTTESERDSYKKLNDIKDRSAYKNSDKVLDESKDYKSNLDTSRRDFALYEIGSPSLWYTVHVQLFEKLSTPEGKTVWNDITKGEQASVSSKHPEWLGQDMSLRYRPAEWISRDDYTLPMASLCLLEPLRDGNISISDDDTSSDKIDNIGDFIVVPIEDVIGLNDQNNLDKRNDKNPSNLTTSSSNDEPQPRHRVEVRVSRALFAGSGDSFNIATEGPDRFLTLPHRKRHHAQIDLEVRADDNELVRVGSSGRISTVVADSTRISRSIITLQASNTGLASARFRVMARDCGPELSGLIKEKGSEGIVAGPVLLPPKHTRRLRLELPIEIPVDVAHCSVALVNDDDEAVAVRDVVIKKGDRCFCVWHCDCVCLSEDPKLICREMPPSRQAAAGLSAHERSRHARSCFYPDSITLNISVIVIGVLNTLILLGIIKACLGLQCRCVSSWGLDRLLQMPRKLDHYYERNLRNCPVQYDEEGWPIHPESKKRTVRLFSRPIEFVLNLIFFVTVPCLLLFETVRGIMNFINARLRSKKCKSAKASKEETKECFSSHDMQSTVHPRRRRRRGVMRRWMTPGAEELSTVIWQKGLAPNTRGKCETMQPLLHESRPCKLGDPPSCGDSEQDDTEYVLMQMQKSRESLARSQRKPNDSGVSSARNQWKCEPVQSKR